MDTYNMIDFNEKKGFICDMDGVVSNLAFAPFAPMLWLSIVFSVIYAVTGIGTAKAKED